MPGGYESRTLSSRAALAWAGVAAIAFHVAYTFEIAGPAIVVYLVAWFQLAWVRSSRWAFYLGFGLGFACGAPQLWFMYGIFGPAATALWGIFALYLAFFLLASNAAVRRWPRFGPFAIAIFWMAFEYFRSELWWLKFAWLTPGFALSHPWWIAWTGCGVYGFTFVILAALAVLQSKIRLPVRALVCCALLALPLVRGKLRESGGAAGPFVVGIQWEGADDEQILASLEKVISPQPQLELVVLSEYSFNGPVPDSILDWCRRRERYLIAGGKNFVGDRRDFYDSVFVVSPQGDVAFSQAKSVPVQFMRDGLPAQSQRVWDSPWGPIGLAICYDLSYARVIDGLIRRGARALVIPTMDLTDWGAQEHALHARVAPIRAREYGIAIFRVASSGISQFVLSDGTVAASAPFPGQGETIAGVLPMVSGARLPPDRYIAPVALAAAPVLVLVLWYGHLLDRRGQSANRNSQSSPDVVPPAATVVANPG